VGVAKAKGMIGYELERNLQQQWLEKKDEHGSNPMNRVKSNHLTQTRFSFYNEYKIK